MNADAAAGAADEEAGSIFLQVRRGRWLVTFRVFLCSGGEAHLWDQWFGPHPTSTHDDGTLHAGPTFSLVAGQKRKRHLKHHFILSSTVLSQDTVRGS